MQISDVRNRRILLSPLNWGFGHVSRCIGLIDQLIESNSIIIACNSNQEEIFHAYFADKVKYIPHEGYPFKFGGKGNFGWDLFRSYFKLRKRLAKEFEEVKTYVSNENIDLIISDHRYGFRHPNVESIILSHQMILPTRWMEKPVDKIHRNYLLKFDHIWIPDYSDHRLSGKLSRNDYFLTSVFIGPLSRFKRYTIPSLPRNNKIVLVASGPLVYAQQLVDRYAENGCCIIGSNELRVPENCELISNSWLQQDEVIMSSNKIISRSGYSTIMDLDYLKIKSQLIPTPGQREQEYLAEYHQINEL